MVQSICNNNMRTINLNKIKQIDWKKVVKKNKYSIISVLMFAVYFYITIAAIVFLVENVRLAFSVDENFVESQIVNFNLTRYEEISERFNLE